MTDDERDLAIREMVFNAAMTRSALFQHLMNNRRDLDFECDYPKDPVPAEYYQNLYDRDPFGGRVVDIYPNQCFVVQPSVYETERENISTLFEGGFHELDAMMQEGKSWYGAEEDSLVWDELRRADRLSRIGQFGVMYLATDDGRDPMEPAEGVESVNRKNPAVWGPDVWSNGYPFLGPRNRAKRQLNFVQTFPESLVRVTQFDTNRSSARFGKPLIYQLTFNDPSQAGFGVPMATMDVHWSRCIHVSDTGASSSKVFANQAMRGVLNHILNLRKIYGAAAEGYWKSAFMGLSFETHPSLGPRVKVPKEEIKAMVDDYYQGLTRSFTLSGMGVKTIAPSVVDPSSQIDKQIEAICIRIEAPVRIFRGSERAQLASSQDERHWRQLVQLRQKSYVTPRIIVPFVNRCIQLGCLPEPRKYYVDWPEITADTEGERTDIAVKKLQALATYIGGNVESLVPPEHLFTRFLQWSKAETDALLVEAAKHAETAETQQPDGVAAA